MESVLNSNLAVQAAWWTGAISVLLVIALMLETLLLRSLLIWRTRRAERLRDVWQPLLVESLDGSPNQLPSLLVIVGGYRSDTLGEDMELVMRLHRHFRLQDKPYRITFVADSVCWTEAPESLTALRRQRVRWQHGLMDSLWMNRELFFHPKSRLLGWLALPFLLIFEGIGCVIEVFGYVAMIFCFAFGLVSLDSFAAFMLLAIGMGLLLSFTSLLLEEMTFHTYPKFKHLLVLFAVAFLENFGYRQLTTIWRFEGLIQWLRGGEAEWGEMTRTSSWQSAATSVSHKLPSPTVNLEAEPEAKRTKVSV